MQGPSISSAYHATGTIDPAFYDGRVCPPGGASDFPAVDSNYDEPTQAVGFDFRSSPPLKLSDNVTITFVA